MANEQNLVSLATRSERERKEIARKGAIAANKKKKERKTLREELLILLQEDKMQENIALSLVKEALMGNNAGSVTRAFEVIRDTIGEKPTDKLDIEQGKPFEVNIKVID